jgi:tetratricopeptide (TPR) repeat protein
VLCDQLVIDGATEQLQRLRFLSLKNLAGVIACPSRAQEALQLFALAAQEDASDVALWDRYGTLAAETGEWAAAKSAFEEALCRDPRHPTISSKLLQILVHVGDTTRADAFAKYCLEQDPWHPLARRVVRNKTGEEIVAVGTTFLSLPRVYTGPATPDSDSSNATLFPTAYIATVSLEKASWRVLLRQCIKLLSNPLAAVANVKFVAPQAMAVPSPAESAPVVPAALLTPPEDVAVVPAQKAAVAVVEAENPVQSKQPQQKPTEELPVADPDDSKKKQVSGAQPTDTSKDVQDVVSPQRRSVRTTKSRHKSQHTTNTNGTATNTAMTTNGTITDPFSLLRTLAPSLCLPERPESAQLTAPPEEVIRPGTGNSKGGPEASGSSKVASTMTAVAEAEEVHSCELLNVHSIPAVHAAITLVLHFTQPQHAARLPQLAGTSGAVLKLVSMLERQQQWKGQGMAPEQYLVLGELFSDAATTAMRAHAISTSTSNAAADVAAGHTAKSLLVATTTSSSQQTSSELNVVEFQRGGALWLSRFRASHFAAAPASGVCGHTAAAAAAGGGSGSSNTNHSKSNNGPTAAASDSGHVLIEARYWWARGRLDEAASRPTEAYECYSRCSALLLQQQKYLLQSLLLEGKKKQSSSKKQSSRNTTTRSIADSTTLEIKLPHCCLDASITAKSVQAKLELLQLHGVLTDAKLLLSQNKDAEAAAILAPVLLACSDTEYLMASEDRPTWIKALRTLRNAANKAKDSVLALRCHLRLLRAGLPLVPSTIEAVLRGTYKEFSFFSSFKILFFGGSHCSLFLFF